MIYSLSGTYTYSAPGFVVVECAGVGYKCTTSLNTIRELPQTGSQIKLYTYMAVREDAVELFGFSTLQELECFKMLTSVSGVGSKVGTAILSDFTPEQVAVFIASSDVKSLTKASGVGSKLAQRIILELKDKMKKSGIADIPKGRKGSAVMSVVSGNINNAAEALGVLGYTNDDVMPVLSQFDPGLSVEELIHKTLLELGKR
ncbi:MAG: Holliday junction branch migration protein RuvA [Acutalibacteraceae bacterium]|nr:Holliday junction branch migration protein RuvA [Clostridia bacterium]MEE3449191.1 Holliday junction branch migration protein RuvA [Acutalibacteraceae bacterium]